MWIVGGQTELYPDARALKALSKVLIARSDMLNFTEDFEGAVCVSDGRA